MDYWASQMTQCLIAKVIKMGYVDIYFYKVIIEEEYKKITFNSDDRFHECEEFVYEPQLGYIPTHITETEYYDVEGVFRDLRLDHTKYYEITGEDGTITYANGETGNRKDNVVFEINNLKTFVESEKKFYVKCVKNICVTKKSHIQVLAMVSNLTCFKFITKQRLRELMVYIPNLKKILKKYYKLHGIPKDLDYDIVDFSW